MIQFVDCLLAEMFWNDEVITVLEFFDPQIVILSEKNGCATSLRNIFQFLLTPLLNNWFFIYNRNNETDNEMAAILSVINLSSHYMISINESFA